MNESLLEENEALASYFGQLMDGHDSGKPGAGASAESPDRCGVEADHEPEPPGPASNSAHEPATSARTDGDGGGIYQMFLVAGLCLAVDEADVVGIARHADLTEQKTGKDGGRGSYNSKWGVLRVVDTAQLIGAGRRQTLAAGTAPPSFVVTRQGLALLCDKVLAAVTVDQHKVIWRSERTGRRWLAGADRERKFAILDAEALRQYDLTALPAPVS
ncbi:MAG TPA: hypothetical protein ENJ19_03840 [Gammaproteobacteria bacterium]|nr:hypothetical protein [Gammaproteobacteria bacterium]